MGHRGALQHDAQTNDAQKEIEDDWLNVFARVAEDKSSDELQILFGKILAGEIMRPGSFSLRTIQIMATISKKDAEYLSNLLAFLVASRVIPFQQSADGHPTMEERLFLEELGVAGHPNEIGGVTLNVTVQAKAKHLVSASNRGIMIENLMDQPVEFSIAGQPVTSSARELAVIANSPSTDTEFLKKVAQTMYGELKSKYAKDVEEDRIKVHMVRTIPEGTDERFGITSSKPYVAQTELMPILGESQFTRSLKARAGIGACFTLPLISGAAGVFHRALLMRDVGLARLVGARRAQLFLLGLLRQSRAVQHGAQARSREASDGYRGGYQEWKRAH